VLRADAALRQLVAECDTFAAARLATATAAAGGAGARAATATAATAAVALPAMSMRAAALASTLCTVMLAVGVVSQLEVGTGRPDGGFDVRRAARLELPVPKGLAVDAAMCLRVAAVTTHAHGTPTPTPTPTNKRRCATCVANRAGLMTAVLAPVAAVVCHPEVDVRVRSRAAAEVLAGALQLQAWGIPADDTLITTLRAALPPREWAGALLQLLWHQLLRGAAAVAPGDTLPRPALDAEPLHTPLHLRLRAAPLLSQSFLAPAGVEALCDAVADAVDLDNAATCERTAGLVAGILSQPPPHLPSPAPYLHAVAPQLLRALHARGVRAGWLRQMAARTLAAALGGRDYSGAASSRDIVAAGWQAAAACHAALFPGAPPPSAAFCGIVFPLVGALFAAVVPPPLSSVVDTQALGEAVEGCHALLTAGGLLSTAAVRLLLPAVQGLLAVYAAAAGTAAYASLASAALECATALLRRLPPPAAAAALCAIAGLPRVAAELASAAVTTTEPFIVPTCYPPPAVVVRTPAGGLELHHAASPVATAAAAAAVTARPALRAGAPPPRASAGAMADLLSVGARLGLAPPPSAASVAGDAGARRQVGPRGWVPLPHGAADEGEPAAGDDDEGAVMNSLVDVVLAAARGVRASGGGNPAAGVGAPLVQVAARSATIGEALFVALLSRFATWRLAAASDGDGDGHVDSVDGDRELRLLLVLCERAGPGVLQSSVAVTQAARTVLHMQLAAWRIPLPSPASVGLVPLGSGVAADTLAASLPARIHDAACRQFDPPAGPPPVPRTHRAVGPLIAVVGEDDEGSAVFECTKGVYFR